MVTVKEWFGSSQTYPADLRRFVRAWYAPDDHVLMVGIPEGTGGPLHMAVPARELAEIEDLDGLTETQEHGLHSLYLGVHPLRADHTVTLRRRGGNRDVPHRAGFFADLDVKPGGFPDKAALAVWVDALPLPPTLVVDNGHRGGAHAYWSIRHEDRPWITDDDARGWHGYLAALAPEAVALDRLVDRARLARAPGGVYWGPGGPGGASDAVRLVREGGPVYTLAEIREVSAEYAAAEAARVARVRASVDAPVVPADAGPWWPARRIMAEEAAERLDWSEILTPHGWSHIGDGDHGVRVWARPGSDRKSATTDYQGSGVMSLYSWSPETGLLDLKEAAVTLTKYRVLCALRYGGDESALVNGYIQHTLNQSMV